MPPGQCPSSAPAPPQGARGRSGQRGTPQEDTGPLSAQPLPRVLGRVASKAADAAFFYLIQERLHDKYAPLVLQNILGLRGLYVKLGQAISIAPMAPDQYREQLAVLQNGVPPKSPAEVRRIIIDGLGKPIAKLFKWIADEPIGSASIGQVHRAELLDGRQVVVKIQYPEVKANFASDLSQMRHAARMWSPSVLQHWSKRPPPPIPPPSPLPQSPAPP